MWIIGLTGAIGSGKSRASKYFKEMGIPVHCADNFIHFLFDSDPEVQQEVRKFWPEVFIKGKIDRLLLGEKVLSNPDDLKQLENILYPKLADDQKRFIKKNQYNKKAFVVLDVPLLFEVGLDIYCDYVILVSSPASLREQRVMAREGMTSKKYMRFKNLQIKDSERRKRADFILFTGRDKGYLLRMLKKIILALSQRPIPKWHGRWPKILKRRVYE